MAIATDAQVQRMADERFRPICQRIRALVNEAKDLIVADDDVYQALTQGSPTWTDTNPSAPPHLLTPGDVLSIHTFLFWFAKFSDGGAIDMADGKNLGGAQYPTVQKACILGL